MQGDDLGGAVYELLRRRWNRREILLGGGLVAVAGSVGCSDSEPVAEPEASVFATIAGTTEDRIVVPEGFASDVLLRWGDPLLAGAEGIDMAGVLSGALLESGAAVWQAGAFGTSCDGMGIVPLAPDRLLICINHETPEMTRMFPGWGQALREQKGPEFVREHPEMIAVMRASVGVSVLEIEHIGDRWQLRADSPLNRRITADTPIEFSGPAANHPWLDGSETERGHCLGTLGNCAAGATPWGTYLTAEENTNDFFGNAAAAEFEPLLRRTNERFGMRPRASVYRWEVTDERFDHAKHPAESMKFGWIVEIDPRDPGRPVRKRTALGRFRHEGATTVLDSDNHAVVYMGDDSGFEYFYKFVSEGSYDPANPDSAENLLDTGTLYVARLDEDGSGVWLPLAYGVHPELTAANEFRSQADVVLRCREAADLVGATPLDRPEDVAVHPHDGRVYLACTQGLQRGLEPPPRPPAEPAVAVAVGTESAAAEEAPGYPDADAANPRGPNPYGHILEFSESGGDAAALSFRWEVFVLAGDPATRGLASVAIAGRLAPAVAYYAGRSDLRGLSAFANPDNLGFDAAGNLWIVTDGAQPQGNNNGCFVCPTSGSDRGMVRQFMSGPAGAEISGCTFAPDGETLFLSVQHPGSGGTLDQPASHWPDGGDARPRSSLIAIRSVDPLRRFHT